MIQDLITGESEFIKDIDFFTFHHLKHADSPDAPSEVSSQKEAIFRNIEDIKSFHNKWACVCFYYSEIQEAFQCTAFHRVFVM